jgi:hypothetical protein
MIVVCLIILPHFFWCSSRAVMPVDYISPKPVIRQNDRFDFPQTGARDAGAAADTPDKMLLYKMVPILEPFI